MRVPVIAGWRVVAMVLNRESGQYQRRSISRTFHVKQAAEQFCELARLNNIREPNVEQVIGYEQSITP
jgi:hypothetical protein